MDKKTEALYSKFRNENWNSMTPQQRLDTLQELANYSAELNHAAPQKVTVEELEGAAYGYFDGEKIVVNKHILDKGMMVKTVIDEETGEKELLTREVQDANLQMMDTIFHEDFHAFQEQAVNGEIPAETLKEMGITQETIHNWQSNNTIMNYVDPEIDGSLYRIQGLEESAFRIGEMRTQQAFGYLNEKYGEDPNFKAYQSSIQKNSYTYNLNMAQMRYGDMDIQNTLQYKMNERYYLENIQYSNEIAAQDVEHVLNKSMQNSMQNRAETHTGLGHSNFGGFGNSTGDTGLAPDSGGGKGLAGESGGSLTDTGGGYQNSGGME